MTPGSSTFVDLEVLKFAEDGFSFNWIKVGSRCQLNQSLYPNVLSFSRVGENDLGYYRCDVKERGKVVLTVYRALYNTSDSEEGIHVRV